MSLDINPGLWQDEEVPIIRIGNRRRDFRFMITTSESKSVDILRSDDERSIEPKKSYGRRKKIVETEKKPLLPTFPLYALSDLVVIFSSTTGWGSTAAANFLVSHFRHYFV